MKYLFVNGDSYAHGLSDLEFNVPYKNRYSRLLANYFDLEEINISNSGASNDTIVRTTLDWIENNNDKIHETIFLIGWTISIREEHFNFRKKKWVVNKNWKKYEHEYAISDKTFNERMRNNILLLQSFFKLNNLKYYFNIAFGESPRFYKEKKLIDSKYFCEKSFMDVIIENDPNFYKGKVEWWNNTKKEGYYRHPTEEEHNLYFHYLKERLYEIL